MTKTLALLIGASAIALMGIAAPAPASAANVGVDVGPGGVYIGSRHRHYYDDDWRYHHRDHRGAYLDRDYRRYHHEY
jgi:hypothetical protein